ncbi:hypothetical protein MRX96_030659 [Rhipicephalus microplus]
MEDARCKLAALEDLVRPCIWEDKVYTHYYDAKKRPVPALGRERVFPERLQEAGRLLQGLSSRSHRQLFAARKRRREKSSSLSAGVPDVAASACVVTWSLLP